MLVHHSMDSARTTTLFAFRILGDASALEGALRALRSPPLAADAIVSESVDGGTVVALALADSDSPPGGWGRAALVEVADALCAVLAAADLHVVLADPLESGLAQRLLSLVHSPPGAFNAS